MIFTIYTPVCIFFILQGPEATEELSGTDDEVLLPTDEYNNQGPSNSVDDYYDYGGSKGDRETIAQPQGPGGTCLIYPY